MPDQTEALPGFHIQGLKPGDTGPVEAGVVTTLTTLRAGGWITDAHAHVEALARSTAYHYDRLSLSEKAYGRAQVVQALAKVFELLPQPDAAADKKWDAFMELLAGAEER